MKPDICSLCLSFRCVVASAFLRIAIEVLGQPGRAGGYQLGSPSCCACKCYCWRKGVCASDGRKSPWCVVPRCCTGLSWCDQNWKGLCDQNWKSGPLLRVFVVACEFWHEAWRASAEDRALRGRNLSAARSLANGRSGRVGGPACPCRSQLQSEKSIIPHVPSVSSDSSFDRTQNSNFVCYTTISHCCVDSPPSGDYYSCE